jgi:hypothetical protein
MPRAVIYISEFQNKLAWKFDISVSVTHSTRSSKRQTMASFIICLGQDGKRDR